MSPSTQPIAPVEQKWSRLILNYALHIIIGIAGILIMPLLIVSHRFQENFFAFIYVIMQRFMNEEVATIRQAVLSHLNEMSPQKRSSSVRDSLRVLEVGAAYGPNLEFIQRPVEYWTVEPNRSFEDSFMRNLQRNSNVEMKQLITGHGEDMHMLPDGYFDAVVLFFVLCSAKDGSKLLGECKRVLKKGGRLLFAEHVGYKKGTFSRFIQDTLTPLSKKCACGCHMNRESGAVLENAGFTSIEINSIQLNVPVLLRNNIYGIATA